MPEVALEGKTLVKEEGWVGSAPVRGSLFVKLPEAPYGLWTESGSRKGRMNYGNELNITVII